MLKKLSSFFEKIGSILGHKDTSVNQKISPTTINIDNININIKVGKG